MTSKKSKFGELISGNCNSSSDFIMTNCILCNKKGAYFVVAYSAFYPFFGRKRCVLLCKEHHILWNRRELVL
jgi:endonuclease IV